MIFTSTQPFTSVLIGSNIKNFKYTWVWEKSKATGYLNAKKMPMRAHEDICIFYRKPPVYNPQMTQGDPYNNGKAHRPTDVYGKQVSTLVKNDTNKTSSNVQHEDRRIRIEQAFIPKARCSDEYLIKTYSNER